MSYLQGVSAPQLTPFADDGSVNLEEYTRLSEYLAEAGLKGIFVCGTTGEFVNLTLEERKACFKLQSRAAKDAAKSCSM